ncbi:hypothetical protein SKAU_G00366770 [Synaphobranchus kaupii]|uniref:Ig-like domain-containing protein n=1 Tax=Synaphobranchus kaupii TaxID=118154 RepID=A0A9Q1IFK1_SYNKA|nr:hypothetical protein SKAU_G00366770 [Synaphobranchus kaupii]
MISSSAPYCSVQFEFKSAGSESQSRTVVLQQPESESVQPGDSVTLQCTVHTETCAGEHWGSGAVSPTQSCVYNFPKRNLSLSDAGTYYCAVATCGEILFGNGTKLDFEGEVHLFSTHSLVYSALHRPELHRKTHLQHRAVFTPPSHSAETTLML